MKATVLEEIKTSRDMLATFGGYDARTRISEGSFAKECDLTSRHYPLMATRDPRAVLAHVDGLQGLLLKDKFAWIAGGKFYYEGVEIPGATFSRGEKIMISMGSRIVVFPETISYNPLTGSWKNEILEQPITEIENVYQKISLRDMTEETGVTVWGELQLNINDLSRYKSSTEGAIGIHYDIAGGGEHIKSSLKHVNSEGEEINISKTGNPIYYHAVVPDGARFDFLPMESQEIVVRIITTEEKIEEVRQKLALLLDGTVPQVFLYRGVNETVCCHVEKVEEAENLKEARGYEIIEISLSAERAYTSEEWNDPTWKLAYAPPPMLDYVIESGNRLWGCRYGEAWNGEFVNEIYATALGSPADWNTMEGIASDAYAASCGSDGPFTGAIYYSGSLYFFKETGFHRVTGTKPSNFQVSFFSCRGVEEGSERSLVLHGDALYYKGVDGIYRYDGSVPYKISEALGDKRYRNAVAGVLGDRIYFEMEDETGARSVFVYDVARGLWNVERAVGALRFVPAFGNLVYMTEDTIGLMSGEGIGDDFLMFENIEREAPFSWFGEFGDFGLADPDAKYISKLQLRMEADEGARVTVEVMCDSDGSWETLAVMDAGKKQSRILPVVIRRCDHFRLRISGVGGFRLWTLTKEMESTNEVRA